MESNRNIVIYMAFVFLSNLAFMSPFLSMYILSKGISLSMVSILFFIYQFSKFALELPTGYISDRYGRKVSGLIGIVILVFANVFLLFSNVGVLMVSFFVHGLGITFISGSIESLFVESVDQDKLIQYNVIERFIFYASMALSAAAGGIMIQYIGYVYTLVVDILVLLLTLVLVLLIREKPRCIIKGEKAEIEGIWSVVRRIIGNKCVFLFLVMDFANAFAYVAVEDFYSPFLKDLGVDSGWIGIAIAIQLLVSSLFGFLMPKITQRFSHRKLLYVLPAVRGVVSLLIYVVKLPVICIPVIFMLSSILFVIYAPIKYQFFQQNIDADIRSTTLSVQSLMVSLGSMLFFIMSSILGNVLSIGGILTIALIITTVMLIGSSKMLQKEHVI